MSPRVAVVGSINQDLVVHAIRVPQAGETVVGQSFAISAGGKGANQAVALARLGMDVTMVGCVGADSFGTKVQAALDREGVRTGSITTVPGPSGTALVQVEQRGENRITIIPGANAALGPQHLESHWHDLGQCAMILTQLETPMPATLDLASRCQAHGIPLMLDPAPAPAERLSPALLECLHWLTPNLTEAQALLGSTDAPATSAEAISMAERLLCCGPQGVLLKLGGMGAVAVHRGQPACFHPAFPVNVEDTTAAGDAANAAFASALVLGLPIPRALRFASAAAALCVTRHGAQQAMPTRTDVEAFLGSAPEVHPSA